MNLPEGWYYDKDGVLSLDPPVYDSFRKAVKAFKQLEKETSWAVLCQYNVEDKTKPLYAVYDEGPVIDYPKD